MRTGPEVRGHGGSERKRGVHSEYGGLVLGADRALGFLGVREPRGAAPGLRIPLRLRNVALRTQVGGVKLVHPNSLTK